jgi:hypothetical protein
LSVNSSVALEDSAFGSWNPLADKLLATGTPKMPSTTASNPAAAMTRRGAAIASRAVRFSSSILRSRAVAGAALLLYWYLRAEPGQRFKPTTADTAGRS